MPKVDVMWKRRCRNILPIMRGSGAVIRMGEKEHSRGRVVLEGPIEGQILEHMTTLVRFWSI